MSCIYFGNGLDEVIVALVLLFAHEGDLILFSENTFSAYQESVRLFLRRPVITALTNYRISVKSILTNLKQGVKLVFLCNPHNPTGSSLS